MQTANALRRRHTGFTFTSREKSFQNNEINVFTKENILVAISFISVVRLACKLCFKLKVLNADVPIRKPPA